MAKTEPTAPSPEYITQRAKKAAELMEKHNALQRELLAFIQEDIEAKTSGWNGPPITYCQFVLTNYGISAVAALA